MKKIRNAIYLIGGGLIGLSCLLSINKYINSDIAESTYRRIEQVGLGNNRSYNSYKEAINISDLEEVKIVNFDLLKEQNHETVGWISMEQLDIEYPIVQTTNNEYYLKHMFDGTKNECGTIMLNCDNKAEFTDQNSIIFGHTLNDNSMFGPLKELLNEKDNIENFIIYTPNETIEYEVVIVAEVEKTDMIYQISFDETKPSNFQECVKNLKAKASYFVDPGVTADKIVTLSTCKGNKRLIVVARRV
ncbi:MAG: class B sortase [Suipraeoptans sp.]